MDTQTESISYISLVTCTCECTLDNKPRCNEDCEAEKSPIIVYSRKQDGRLIYLSEEGLEARLRNKPPGESCEATGKGLAAIAAFNRAA